MSRESDADGGLTNCRNWTALPADAPPVEWTVDSSQGHLQGPLDLDFLRDKRLTLLLDEGQQALLVRRGQLQAVFLAGAHQLAIGRKEGQISPKCHLIFLATDEPLVLRWTRAEALAFGPRPEQSLIGSCALHVERPRRFFETFLQGKKQWDSAFVLRLIDHLVRSRFEHLLGATDRPSSSGLAAEMQARLTGLTPDHLNDDLQACGLFCSHLAVYTAHPPVEETQTAPTGLAPVEVY